MRWAKFLQRLFFIPSREELIMLYTKHEEMMDQRKKWSDRVVDLMTKNRFLMVLIETLKAYIIEIGGDPEVVMARLKAKFSEDTVQKEEEKGL